MNSVNTVSKLWASTLSSQEGVCREDGSVFFASEECSVLQPKEPWLFNCKNIRPSVWQKLKAGKQYQPDNHREPESYDPSTCVYLRLYKNVFW